MPPKSLRGDRLKPGSNDRRAPQSLSLGLPPNIRNTRKKLTSKIQGASEDKLPAPMVDDGSRSMTKTTSVGHPEGKPVVPKMFKHSQHTSCPLSSAERSSSTTTTATTMITGRKQTAGLMEYDNPNGELIISANINTWLQIQGDNKKARVATKHLQVALSKVAKTCSEIGERIAMIESCASVLEGEVGTMAQQSALHETQLTDIQWKIKDIENQQRRNNLRILGIEEGVEGQDPRAFIVKIFRATFTDLDGWDWEKEIQRAHRFALYLKQQRMAEEASVNRRHARAIIVYFGNYVLRQAVFERARPDSRIN
ncbi:hypothetical protein NDU88_000027 [Pleurodeles waltl]|uniref:Uncharacterized protein n=1 Tax=Pleurodeles waltl TaxID=8319 RepID=A0AAV7UNU0_PLEWA|nr:hypothetical protein NDU88_000027 [Pleurodeles waltl]